jgi:serine/threonine protein kinase
VEVRYRIGVGTNPGKDPVRIVGQYELCGVMSRGGMGTVHYGRLMGPGGFSRTVAIKQLHSHFVEQPEFLEMFSDEARTASRVQHPNVVPMLDVVALKDELFLVMEYIQGETLAHLLTTARAARATIPPPIVSAIVAGMLYGLHAAHEAKHPKKGPLNIVHRDVSPENVLIGVDGTPRIFDFGIAKAVHRLSVTRPGQIKGKVSYLAPEQIRGDEVTRQTDIFAASVVLWESLTGRRLFEGLNDEQIIQSILTADIEPPSEFASTVAFDPTKMYDTSGTSSEAIDEVVMRGLARDPKDRFATAKEMAIALEQAMRPAPQSAVGEWVESVAHETLAQKATILAQLGTGASLNVAVSSGFPAAANVASNPQSGRVSTLPEPVTVPPVPPDVLAQRQQESFRRMNAHPPPPQKDRLFIAAITIGVIALAVAGASLVYLAVTLASGD